MYSTLIDVSQLGALVRRPEVVILDCRFELAAPGSRRRCQAGHIPGSLCAPRRDLSGPVDKTTGRHPLPDPSASPTQFGRLGINAMRVVTYDGGPGAYAARARWLPLARPRAVAVLNGGFAAQQAAVP